MTSKVGVDRNGNGLVAAAQENCGSMLKKTD